MRIDAYNKLSKIYNTSSVKKTSKSGKSSFSDKFEISQEGRNYQVAKQIIFQVPDVREDKVREIKKQMDAGTYNVGMDEVADKVVSRYFNELV